jgi:4-hydroxybenzoate polyprenyltransferase
LKNLLLFAPLVAALRFTDVSALIQLGIGFLSFSFCASSVYLLNDIMDMQDDRQHPRKRFRPFASGDLPVMEGIILIPLLLTVAAGLALLLPPKFGMVLAIYYATTVAYTFKLKEVEVLDVVALAMLYTTRVFAGGAAAGIHISFWLLSFSIFLFLSLALAKRCAELCVLRARGKGKARGRGYRVSDLPVLFAMGIGAGYVATFVFGLYLNSPQVGRNYDNPAFLWAFIPILLYWTTRIWLRTYRSEMHDDPVVYTARDPVSLGLALLGSGVIAMAV